MLRLMPPLCPCRRTGPSTSLSSPWRAPRAVCSTCAAVPFAGGLANSASASSPGCPCRRPCTSTSFWSQRAFCAENQSTGTRGPPGLVLAAPRRWARRVPQTGQAEPSGTSPHPGGHADLPQLQVHLGVQLAVRALPPLRAAREDADGTSACIRKHLPTEAGPEALRIVLRFVSCRLAACSLQTPPPAREMPHPTPWSPAPWRGSVPKA